MEIKTDHKWKQFKYGYEVPKKVMSDYFDHLFDDSNYDSFILYHKRWYHVSDFMRLDKNNPFGNKWHGYSSDSYFSGILIELSNDGEKYRIGTYYS